MFSEVGQVESTSLAPADFPTQLLNETIAGEWLPAQSYLIPNHTYRIPSDVYQYQSSTPNSQTLDQYLLNMRYSQFVVRTHLSMNTVINTLHEV